MEIKAKGKCSNPSSPQCRQWRVCFMRQTLGKRRAVLEPRAKQRSPGGGPRGRDQGGRAKGQGQGDGAKVAGLGHGHKGGRTCTRRVMPRPL